MSASAILELTDGTRMTVTSLASDYEELKDRIYCTWGDKVQAIRENHYKAQGECDAIEEDSSG